MGGGALAGVARVVLSADTAAFNRDMQGAERQFGQTTGQMQQRSSALGATLGGLRRQVGLLAGAAGIGLFVASARSAVTAASDLDESMNKVRETFRDSADEILAWSKTSATALGMSRAAALENAGSIGAMLVPMGVARDRAADMSRQMVQLAGDMASFNNQDPSEMLNRLRSALSGEAEPLRRFGVNVTAVRVEQFAWANGIAETGRKLTDQEKVLARYGLILQDAKDQLGDFGRTSDGLANSQRILQAQTENLRASLGQALAPAIASVVSELAGWAGQLAENEDMQERLTRAVDGGVEMVKGMIEAGSDVARVLDTMADAVGGLENALKILLTVGITRWMAGVIGVAGAGAAAGTGILGAASAAALLRSRLLLLARMGPIAIPVSIVLFRNELREFLEAVNQAGPGLAQYLPEWMQQAIPMAGNQPPVAAPVPSSAGQRIQVPTSIARPTHQTAGLAGFPAVDMFGQPGTPVLAPEDGRITRTTGRAPGVGDPDFNGFSLYYVGASGTTYYIAHLHRVGKLGDYKRGQVIATIAAGTTGGPHAHIGIRKGPVPSPIAFGPSTSRPPGLITSVSDFQRASDPRRGRGSEGTVTDPTKDPPGKVPLIPYTLQLRLAEAEVTKGTADDLAALRAVEQYLVKRLASEKNVEKRIELLAQLKATRSRIESLRKPPAAGRKGLDEIVPPGLQLRLAQAELTPQLADDLAAWRAVEAHLERRAAVEKNVTQKTRILQELRTARTRITQLEDQQRIAGPDPAAIPGLAGVLTTFARTRAGQEVVNLPGLGQILVGTLKPSKDAWQKVADQLKAKLQAAIERRAALVRQLRRAQRAPARLRQPALIRHLQDAIRRLDEDIAEIRAALGDALTAVAELGEAESSETQRKAAEDERSSLAGVTDLPADLRLAIAQADLAGSPQDALAGLQQAEQVLAGRLARGTTDEGYALTTDARIALTSELARVRQQIAGAVDRAMTEMPADLRHARAVAAGTPDTADDAVVVRQMRDLIAGRLREAQQLETRIRLQEQLNALNDELARLAQGQLTGLEEEHRQFVGFLTSVRGLRSFRSNLVEAMGLAGATLTVNNYYQHGPEDPHLWSRAVQFELGTLVG